MNVIHNGKKLSRSYEDICKDLGFLPEIHFVKVKRAKIGFTLGKPHEIKALYAAVVENGYEPSNELINTIKFMRGELK